MKKRHKVRLLTREELNATIDAMPEPSRGILFATKRGAVDEAIGLIVDGHIVSVATISAVGETRSEGPSVIGMYTFHAYRRKGYAEKVLQAVIKRCRERGFDRVRIDVLSGHIMRIIKRLPQKDQQYLDVHDHGSVMDFMR